jgi:hypothetical protein
MGAGLHGLNGLSPITSYKLYRTYVLPRLLYGTDSIVLNQTEKNALDDFHRGTLRQIQHLPIRTAIPAIYILLGALPIEAELDKRKLTLFGAIARDRTTLISEIAERQLVMKPLKSTSWFADIMVTCYKYGLTSPLEMLRDPPSKSTWKKQITTSVNYYWSTRVKAEASQKSTLRFLTTENIDKPDLHPHTIWSSTEMTSRDIQRAFIQAKMSTDTYILQAHRSIYSDRTESAICPLCNLAPEDLTHLLVSCPDTQHHRDWFTTNTGINPDNPKLAQIILDPTNFSGIYDNSNLHFMTRLLCFKIHHHRATKLGYSLGVKHSRAVRSSQGKGGGTNRSTGGSSRGKVNQGLTSDAVTCHDGLGGGDPGNGSGQNNGGGHRLRPGASMTDGTSAEK